MGATNGITYVLYIFYPYQHPSVKLQKDSQICRTRQNLIGKKICPILFLSFPIFCLLDCVGKSMGTHKYARRTWILIHKTNYIPSNIFFHFMQKWKKNVTTRCEIERILLHDKVHNFSPLNHSINEILNFR